MENDQNRKKRKNKNTAQHQCMMYKENWIPTDIKKPLSRNKTTANFNFSFGKDLKTRDK